MGAMEIESCPWSREEQTELPEPIKVRFTGRLRKRINERAADLSGAYVNEGDPAPGSEVFIASRHRAYSRQKTNIVIETEEEAYSVLIDIEKYASGSGREGIPWMNGPMVDAAQRVHREINDRLNDMGIEIDRL